MRKSLFVFMFALLAAGVSAKGLLDFGVKAGIMTTKTEITDPNKGGLNNVSSDPHTGWEVGIVSRINLMLFHVQPEILYNMNYYDLKATNDDGGVSTAKVNLSTVDVPVLLGLRLLFLRINLGPTFNLLTDTKVRDNTGENIFVQATRPSVGYTGGLGIDIGKLNIDARYNGNFSHMKQDITIGDAPTVTYDTKFNSWIFSVGYVF